MINQNKIEIKTNKQNKLNSKKLDVSSNESKVNNTFTSQNDKLQTNTKLSSLILTNTSQIIDYKTYVPVKELYKSKIDLVKNLPLPKIKNNVKYSLSFPNYYKMHFPQRDKTNTPLYKTSKKPSTSNIKSQYHTNKKKRSYQQTLSVSTNTATSNYIYHNIPLNFHLYASATNIKTVQVQNGGNEVISLLAFSYKKLPFRKKIKCKLKEKLQALYSNVTQCRNKIVNYRDSILKTNNQSIRTADDVPFGNQNNSVFYIQLINTT